MEKRENNLILYLSSLHVRFFHLFSTQKKYQNECGWVNECMNGGFHAYGINNGWRWECWKYLSLMMGREHIYTNKKFNISIISIYRHIGDTAITCICPPGFKGNKCDSPEFDDEASKLKIFYIIFEILALGSWKTENEVSSFLDKQP